MTNSPDDPFIKLAFAVRAVLRPSHTEVPTRAVFKMLVAAGHTIPGTTEQAKWRTLGRLAERGYPGAFQGEAKDVTRWGKTLKVRPWSWKDVPLAEVEQWASRPRSGKEQITLTERVAALEARVAELEAGR